MFPIRLCTHHHSERPAVGFCQSVSFTIHTVNTSTLLRVFLMKHPHGFFPKFPIALLLIILNFRNELQRAAEYSKAWDTTFGSIIYELVTKTVTAFTTFNLIGAPSLFLFGQTVLMDSFGEGWPGWWMFIFRLAGKQLISTFWTNIYASFKVILKKLPFREWTERHGKSNAIQTFWKEQLY